uniref:Uncharacterized protein n=1 Tax=Ixodes ricinus TaxID=34613 RepID=A0A6B0U7F6_IXORI
MKRAPPNGPASCAVCNLLASLAVREPEPWVESLCLAFSALDWTRHRFLLGEALSTNVVQLFTRTRMVRDLAVADVLCPAAFLPTGRFQRLALPKVTHDRGLE